MADDKFALRANDGSPVESYRSPTSAAAEARGKASGAAAIEQAAFDNGQSKDDTVPAANGDKPGPLTIGPKPVLTPFGGASPARKTVEAYNIESGKLTPPKYTPIPPPVPKTSEPMDVWGSMAMVLAALGSMKTRQPLTTAMNAAAGVIKGFHDGNKESADAQFQTWKAASDNAIQNTRFEMDAYKTALGDLHTNEDNALKVDAIEARDRALILANMFKDPGMTTALQEDPTGKMAVELQKNREDQVYKLEQAKLENSANYMVMQATRELQASPEYQDMTPMERANALSDIQKKFKQSTGSRFSIPLTPEQKPKIVEMLKKYEIDPPNDALMSRNPDWADALQQAKQEDPSYDPAMAPVIRRARTELSTGKGGAVRQSADALTHHLTFLQALADNLPNTTDKKVINSMTAAIARQFGYPNVTSYELAVEIVGTEASRMIAGTGANAGALADRMGLKKEFEPSLSKDQINANIQTAKVLAAGQYAALEHRYDFLPQNVKNTFFKPETDRFYGIDRETGQPRTDLNGGGKPGEAVAPNPVSGSPPVSELQEGHGTEFSNGSVWTLMDGNPVQVR